MNGSGGSRGIGRDNHLLKSWALRNQSYRYWLCRCQRWLSQEFLQWSDVKAWAVTPTSCLWKDTGARDIFILAVPYFLQSERLKTTTQHLLPSIQMYELESRLKRQMYLYSVPFNFLFFFKWTLNWKCWHQTAWCHVCRKLSVDGVFFFSIWCQCLFLIY